ncbi:response regulator [Microbispora hainanensis]|uniref:response regulator n=1 Tax=Microbispora hainanensis TaxID=568844 RepID=UPI003CC745EF
MNIHDRAPALSTTGLRKTYGETRVVDRIDLVVNRGEVVALLGPNGAGESTTIDMVVGLFIPVSTFPDALATVAKVLPSYWLAQVGHAAALDGAIGEGGGQAALVLTLYTLVLGVAMTAGIRLPPRRRILLVAALFVLAAVAAMLRDGPLCLGHAGVFSYVLAVAAWLLPARWGVLLAVEPDIEVMAQVGSGEEVVEAARRSRPDVALLDVQMPGRDGLEVTADLRAALPS